VSGLDFVFKYSVLAGTPLMLRSRITTATIRHYRVAQKGEPLYQVSSLHRIKNRH